ncbi:MAG: lipoyl(octanoyl) transferase LipB, partial [Myxococcota bacterium]|nr:lipoyl(octanoyl) transferase LipB [Myxococcota bacterium]
MNPTWLGRLAYADGLEAQLAARERVLGDGPDELLLLEHEPVVTLGKRGGDVNARALAQQTTPVVQTDRGGFATWHGPGQLVGYPIVNLRRARKDVPAFVAELGGWLRETCEALGVSDVVYDACRPGVYRDGRKLGSIGLHIHKGVTTHGFALNVCNTLEGFGAIVVCGHQDLSVTTVAIESGRDVTIDDGEITEHEWMRPVDAMKRRDVGDIELAPPTWVTLNRLA